MMELTKHGEERIRKRIGINKKSINKMKKLAFDKGVAHKDVIGSLKKYYDYLFFKNKTATNVRIYSNYVWIFTNDKLVTVFPMPNKYKNVINKINKRLNNETNG